MITIIVHQFSLDNMHTVRQRFFNGDSNLIRLAIVMIGNVRIINLDSDGVGENLLAFEHPRAPLMESIHNLNLEEWRFRLNDRCVLRLYQNASRKPTFNITGNAQKIAGCLLFQVVVLLQPRFFLWI